MRSLLDAPPSPQVLRRPGDVHSLDAALDTIELANAYLGHELIPAQELVLEVGLGQRADESWSASTVCHFGGRQGAGKNETVIARELAGLRLFGEQLILHTAHEFKTANESFLRLVSIFENFDDLRRLVARIRYANGEQGIEFLSGQRLKFLARTGGAGRGFAGVDLLVLDEAQHLQPEHLAALGPTMLANPNAQAWAMGSGGLSSSEVAWRWRRQGLTGGADRFAYVEFTAEHVRLLDGKVITIRPDSMDRAAWAKAMPAYGYYVSDESVLQLYDLLGPEKFSREGLCMWDAEPNSGGGIVPLDLWQALAYNGRPAKRLRYALDVDENADGQQWASIGCSDGTHLELVTPPTAGPGTRWVVAECVKHRAKIGELLVAGDGPASVLIPDLEAAGVAVHKVTPEEFQAASMTMLTAVVDQTVHHLNQPVLNAAVAGALARDVGDGKWRLSRTLSQVDIGPFCAVAMARQAAAVAGPEREFFGAYA